MSPRRSWTRALPIVILAVGFLIPACIGREGPERVSGGNASATYAGRTAAQWESMAERALDEGAYAKALKCIKSAERVEPGRQYARELDAVRRRRWEARELAFLERRFLEGRPAHAEYEKDGGVRLAYRTTVALPGESLWSLAADIAAARTGVLPGRGIDESEVYRWWDDLTELNGLRELEVGEAVRLPLPEDERAALAARNIEEMDLLAQGLEDVRTGDLDAARQVLGSVSGEFARGTERYARLDEEIARAEKALRVERERELVVRAHELAARADTLSRATSYDEYTEALGGAREALEEAEALSEGEQYGQAIASLNTLVREAGQVRVADDGTVVVAREPGEPFTNAALGAVEWLLERELERGDAQFPHVEEKTPDQIAWASFLMAVSELAEERGTDLAAVIASDDGGEIVLPHPADYFAF